MSTAATDQRTSRIFPKLSKTACSIQRCSSVASLIPQHLHLMQKINNKEICLTTNLTNNMSNFNEIEEIEENQRSRQNQRQNQRREQQHEHDAQQHEHDASNQRRRVFDQERYHERRNQEHVNSYGRDLGDDKERKKKKMQLNSFSVDLSDVPPQPPIPKNGGHIKEGASKYTGVYFHKQTNKWKAIITIEGKQHYIGLYENEEEAAIDYARAVFKYNGQEGLDKAREKCHEVVDLSDVPPQPPIPKSQRRIKEGASKYTGVCFNKQKNKWQAQIYINGKVRSIGLYENEEEAAVDYARAVFKYKGQVKQESPPPQV
jgi:TolA-binding protein